MPIVRCVAISGPADLRRGTVRLPAAIPAIPIRVRRAGILATDRRAATLATADRLQAIVLRVVNTGTVRRRAIDRPGETMLPANQVGTTHRAVTSAAAGRPVVTVLRAVTSAAAGRPVGIVLRAAISVTGLRVVTVVRPVANRLRAELAVLQAARSASGRSKFI